MDPLMAAVQSCSAVQGSPAMQSCCLQQLKLHR